MANEKSLFEKVGGEEIFRKINKVFYDKIYKHPWIGLYFQHFPQEEIENQQTDFMIGAFGGPQKYSGRIIPDAHRHLFVTEELFQLRAQLLNEAFAEVGAPKELIERWTKIDLAFKPQIIKKSLEECSPKYAAQGVLNFPNPEKGKKAA